MFFSRLGVDVLFACEKFVVLPERRREEELKEEWCIDVVRFHTGVV